MTCEYINITDMNILDSYEHTLRFRLDTDAPQDYMKRWENLKQECENHKRNNNTFFQHWKQKCSLLSNINLPILDRVEGGLGGNNNTVDKQLRFRSGFGNSVVIKDHDIVMNIYNSDTEKWTYEELDDLINAFVKTANYIMREKCVSGCIELVKWNVSHQ